MPLSIHPSTLSWHSDRQHPLLWRGLGRLLFAVIWRIDEGVCPYKLVLSLIKGTPFSNQGGRFLAMKRAPLHIEETPSLFANSSIYSPLHSERGWGWGSFSPLGGGWEGCPDERRLSLLWYQLQYLMCMFSCKMLCFSVSFLYFWRQKKTYKINETNHQLFHWRWPLQADNVLCCHR